MLGINNESSQRIASMAEVTSSRKGLVRLRGTFNHSPTFARITVKVRLAPCVTKMEMARVSMVQETAAGDSFEGLALSLSWAGM
jgi:hypothetical protein